jgi:hypothetical protein
MVQRMVALITTGTATIDQLVAVTSRAKQRLSCTNAS